MTQAPHRLAIARTAFKTLHTAVLAVALLLGQLGLSVHAVDHSLHPDAPACQLCVHAHSSGGIPAVHSAGFGGPGVADVPAFDPAAPCFASTAGYHARAPPA